MGKDAYDHIQAGCGLADLVPADVTASFEDDGSFAALPTAFLEAASVSNLTNLEYRVLFQVAWHSAMRLDGKGVWKAVDCPSSWIAGQCGNASASSVRAALGRMRRSGILVDERPGDERRCGRAPRMCVNGD